MPSIEDAGGALSKGAGVMNPAAAAYNGAKGMGYGSTGDILGKFAGMDPTTAGHSDFQATPVASQFQAQNPLAPGFAEALAAQQGNANNANMVFQGGPGGAPSFVQGLTQNYQNAQNQQQNLMNNLQMQANGQGPGSQLASNMFGQAANQNAANAMGLMASQKGINPAMAARMAGQQAAQGNQMAAGQAANMNLQQQLAAQSQLGGMLGQNQALNASTFGNLAGMANQNNMGMQTLGSNAGLETQRLNQLTQSQNAANGMGAQAINADTANANVAAKTKMTGGILGSVGSMGSMIGMAAAKGGESPGHIRAVLSPGEIKIPREIAMDRNKAIEFIDKEMGRIPGKSKYSGDDARNDTYHTSLKEHDVIIPRSSANDKDKAIAFIDALKSGDGAWKKGKKK